jgi:hypothetical protein
LIVCHQYKFIFIKVNKTAGTSVEIALSKFCGDDDIITPVSPEDEVVRSSLGYRGPQNYLAPLSDYGVVDMLRFVFRGKKKKRFYNHIGAREVKPLVGPHVWNSYYKFCIERNPWDRVLSLYYWKYKTEPRPSMMAFLQSDTPLQLKRRGFEGYTIDGQVVVDRVCLFEKLVEELESVRLQLGIPEALELPRTKASFRKDKRNYSEILTDAEQMKIAQLFEDEIRLFGYNFSPQ